MDPVKIGTYEDKGMIFTTHKDIKTGDTVQSNVSYDEAVNSAKNHPGAELIINKGGSYDVVSLSIDGFWGKAKDKKIAGAGNLVKFNDNVPGQVGGRDAILMDENNGIRVMMPANDNTDTGKGRHVIAHAHDRELAGARAIAASIGDSGMRSTLNGLLDRLQNAKAEMQQNQSNLNGQLRNANEALRQKRIPYDQAIQAANDNYQSLAQRHGSIVSQKSEDLREAQRPGIHRAEADRDARQSELNDAQSRVDGANRALQAANDKFNAADQQAIDLNAKRGQLRDVNRKYGDYLRGQEWMNAHPNQGYPRDWDQNRGVPLNWGVFDSWYSVQTTKQQLDYDVRTLEASVPTLRLQAQREQADAGEALRQAQQNLSYAQGRFDAASQALNYLPEGNAASIERAQRALEEAKQAQSSALGAAQARINKAQNDLDINTRDERGAVESLKLKLQNAPNAYHQSIDETARKLGL